MNRLIEKNPMAVEIDGIKYKLNTDFRDCLKIIFAFGDKELTLSEQQNILFENLYGDLDGNLPETLTNFKKAYELGIRFLDRDNTLKFTITKEPCFDFNLDSEEIAIGLLNKPNGINLNDIEYMHLWDWMLHFQGMGECAFSNLIYLRNQSKKGKLTKEEQQQCAEIGWDKINMCNKTEEKIKTLEDCIKDND